MYDSHFILLINIFLLFLLLILLVKIVTSVCYLDYASNFPLYSSFQCCVSILGIGDMQAMAFEH